MTHKSFMINDMYIRPCKVFKEIFNGLISQPGFNSRMLNNGYYLDIGTQIEKTKKHSLLFPTIFFNYLLKTSGISN